VYTNVNILYTTYTNLLTCVNKNLNKGYVSLSTTCLIFYKNPHFFYRLWNLIF